MEFVITQGGQIEEVSEGVQEVNLDELEGNPELFFEYSPHIQQYLLANYPESVPENAEEEIG